MKAFTPLRGVLGTFLLMSGCATLASAPEFRGMEIMPKQLHPGDTAIITVTLQDKEAIVDRIEGVVKEDPRITFKLRDDGVDPDASPADGVWTLRVDVPPVAPAGDFMLEFTAYTSDGLPIEVRDANRNVVPLSETLPVSIQYKEE